MDPVVTTGIFSVVGTAGGIVLGYGLNMLSQRSADRRAGRQKAQDLFAQVVKAIGVMEVEKASFRERRDSWRANLLAIGSTLLEVLAARASGNWLRGAAAGTGTLLVWDSAEGARFIDRYQAAAGEIGPALVQPSLMSPGLEAAAASVSDALAAAAAARKPRDREAAGKQVADAIRELRAEVTAFAGLGPKQRRKSIARPEKTDKSNT